MKNILIVSLLIALMAVGCKTAPPPIAHPNIVAQPRLPPCITNLNGSITAIGYAWTISGGGGYGNGWTSTTETGTWVLGSCTANSGPLITIYPLSGCPNPAPAHVAHFSGNFYDGTTFSFNVNYPSCVPWEIIRIAGCCNPNPCITYCLESTGMNCCQGIPEQPPNP